MAFEQAMPTRVTRWIAADPDWDEVCAELPRVYTFFRHRFGNIPEVEARSVSSPTSAGA
ncbi:MAG: hypothetical protein ACRD2X_04300 [Vicinamibacteraceae bacterium]